MGKPIILLDFEERGYVTWHSVGWAREDGLIEAAKAAISNSSCKAEVVALLLLAGFEVVVVDPKDTEMREAIKKMVERNAETLH